MRAFGAVASRCSPPLGADDYFRFRDLLHGARRVLERGLSPELVARSLGFVPDEVEPAFKTVAVLTDADSDDVLSALVFCGDAHKNGAQILVAGTDPAARQGGCMRALLGATAAMLAANGITVLCLATARTDTRAAAVWQRLGFVPAACWPANFVSRQTSADLGTVFTRPTVLEQGARTPSQSPEPKAAARLACCAETGEVGADAAARLPSGVPREWPGEVPFTSGTVSADLHPATWPQVHQPRVIIRRIPLEAEHPCRGQYGVFARMPLQPTDCLMSYGGILRARCDSDSLYLASAGGGLDIDAERCGNETRYLNHYAGIAAAPNADLRIRIEPFSGTRWIAVRLVSPVAAGDEILLDYGEEYSEVLLRPSKRPRGWTPPPFVPRRPRDTRRVSRSVMLSVPDVVA